MDDIKRGCVMCVREGFWPYLFPKQSSKQHLPDNVKLTDDMGDAAMVIKDGNPLGQG